MPDEDIEATGVIPETSLALIAHADGNVEFLVPKHRVGDDTVPPAWLVLAHVFSVKLRDPVWVDEMINETRMLIDAYNDERILH